MNLSAEASEVVAQGREALEPSSAQLLRIRTGIDVRLAAGAAGLAAASITTEAGAASTTAAATASGGAGVLSKIIAVSALVLAGGVGGAAYHRITVDQHLIAPAASALPGAPPARATAPHEPPAQVTAPDPDPALSSGASASGPPAIPYTPSRPESRRRIVQQKPEPTTGSRPLTAPEPAAGSGPATSPEPSAMPDPETSPAPARAVDTPPSNLGREAILLRAARVALDARDYAAAKRALATYRRAFPNGQLSREERTLRRELGLRAR